MEVSHPKGNATPTQTRQLSSEGRTRAGFGFPPNLGEALKRKVEDFEGVTME